MSLPHTQNSAGRRPSVPKYCRHRKPGREADRANVTLAGRQIYLGLYGSPESRSEYDRLIAEYLASGRAGLHDRELVDAIQPYVSRKIWAMVQLQRFSGMRPGDVCWTSSLVPSLVGLSPHVLEVQIEAGHWPSKRQFSRRQRVARDDADSSPFVFRPATPQRWRRSTT